MVPLYRHGLLLSAKVQDIVRFPRKYEKKIRKKGEKSWKHFKTYHQEHLCHFICAKEMQDANKVKMHLSFEFPLKNALKKGLLDCHCRKYSSSRIFMPH